MLALFFFLTFALTWTMFITVAIAVPARTPAGYVMVLLGAYAPAIVAIAITRRADGAAGVSRLLRGLTSAALPARFYVLAAFYLVAVKLCAAVVHRAIAGEWPPFGTASLYLVPAVILFSTPFQAGEEIGWRGYALPRLARRVGLRTASVLLGVIWALWHLPQFYIADADTYHQAFAVWGMQVVALSVAMAWLYARTGGSLLLTMLMHAAINNTKDIVPSGGAGQPPGVFSLHASAVSWLTLGLLWIGAAYFLVRMPGAIARTGVSDADRLR